MSENEIRITFVANCMIVRFLKAGELFMSTVCKYSNEDLKRLEQIVKKVKKEHAYSSVTIIQKIGLGSKDKSLFYNVLEKAGIQILSIKDITPIPHNGVISAKNIGKESNNG